MNKKAKWKLSDRLKGVLMSRFHDTLDFYLLIVSSDICMVSKLI